MGKEAIRESKGRELEMRSEKEWGKRLLYAIVITVGFTMSDKGSHCKLLSNRYRDIYILKATLAIMSSIDYREQE